MRHLLSILLLPFMVLVVIPAGLLLRGGPVVVGWPVALPVRLLLVLGGMLFAALGLILLAQTIALFARVGKGTLAPWDPPRHLVVQGIYQHVRNPMISGVLEALLGEALVLGSPAVAAWWLVAVAINLLYIPLIEEPGLEKRFGADYRLYKQHVPRWLPRRTAWKGLEQA